MLPMKRRTPSPADDDRYNSCDVPREWRNGFKSPNLFPKRKRGLSLSRAKASGRCLQEQGRLPCQNRESTYLHFSRTCQQLPNTIYSLCSRLRWVLFSVFQLFQNTLTICKFAFCYQLRGHPCPPGLHV